MLGATVYDMPHGITHLGLDLATVDPNVTKINVEDSPLVHELIRTASTKRNAMTAEEESIWLSQYHEKLKSFQPDMVCFYGGLLLENMVANEARHLGIPCVAYIGNGNYTGERWYRDVSLILTDSQATARFYKETQNLDMVPIGKFIDPATVLAEQHSRETLLFINPSLQKGAAIVAALAILLATRRPDIRFEVVQSRGDWNAIVQVVSTQLGFPPQPLENVTLTPNTRDMRPVYSRARLLLAPSLWWESGPRVTVEAMMNGIPAIVTKRGGNPEWVKDAGLLLELNDELYEPPYNKIPNTDFIIQVIDRIIELYDDENCYQTLATKAKQVGIEYFGSKNIENLLSHLQPLLAQRAGDSLTER